jgi:hypothetical protein
LGEVELSSILQGINIDSLLQLVISIQQYI